MISICQRVLSRQTVQPLRTILQSTCTSITSRSFHSFSSASKSTRSQLFTPVQSRIISIPSRGIKGVPRKKLKSHSGSKKRFRFTRTGLIIRTKGGKHHKNYNKTSARLRRLSRTTTVYQGHVKSVRRSLPYGARHSR